MTTADLTYSQKDALFTVFYAQSPAGVEAWNQIAAKYDGVATVENVHVASLLKQLRRAGYSVKKTEPVALSEEDLEQLCEELDQLG